MANPRKFSEKIALQKQKQAEGTAEFERIMKEVSDATSKGDEPFFNHRVAEGPATPMGTTTSSHRESRGRSVGVGPMRRPSDRKVDCSPYSSGNTAYLSPPSDSYWRRASSDSAIHQTLIQASGKQHGSHSPLSSSPSAHRRSPHINVTTDHRHSLSNSSNKNSSNIDVCRDSPISSARINSLHTYSLHHDNSLSNSMGNNTGSLPDLTSVHFTTQLNTGLNKEQEQCTSPFSSSPLTTSPTTHSPTSMPNRYYYSPVTSPVNSNTYSPTHYSHIRQEGYDQYRPSHSGQVSHLSFTNLSGLVQLPHNTKNSNISYNNIISGSHGHLASIGIAAAGNLLEYRSPQSRPSPGSSPGISSSLPINDSNPSAPCSPVPHNANSKSHNYERTQGHSNDGYNLTQSFQNHFEQFSLVDNASTDYIPNLQTAQNSFNTIQFDSSSYGQLDSIPNHTSNAENNHLNAENYNTTENAVINKSGNINSSIRTESSSQSPDSQHTIQNSQQFQTSTTTSIPEIIFSDFSSGNQDFSKEIFGSLDLELGPIDVAGLQMLSDPNSAMIADPTIEDSFRRDLN